MAQLSRTLATLLQGGIPLVAALEVARDAPAIVLSPIPSRARSSRFAKGGRCPTVWNRRGHFPDLALEMIRVGEQTGSLPDMLNHVADFYDEDVNIRSAALLSWVEPVILIFVAVFVALILISLYMPIFSIRGVGDSMKEVIETKERDRATAQQLAERYRYEFVELKGVHLDLELFRFDPGRSDVPVQLRAACGSKGNALVVAMADPSDLVVIDEVSALLGRPLIIKVAPLSEIQDLLKKSESSQRMLDEATEGFKLRPDSGR